MCNRRLCVDLRGAYRVANDVVPGMRRPARVFESRVAARARRDERGSLPAEMWCTACLAVTVVCVLPDATAPLGFASTTCGRCNVAFLCLCRRRACAGCGGGAVVGLAVTGPSNRVTNVRLSCLGRGALLISRGSLASARLVLRHASALLCPHAPRIYCCMYLTVRLCAWR